MQEKLIDAITADSLHEDVRVGKLTGNEGLWPALHLKVFWRVLTRLRVMPSVNAGQSEECAQIRMQHEGPFRRTVSAMVRTEVQRCMTGSKTPPT